MVDYPKGASGFGQPQRFEANVYDCETTGTVPKDLAGSFVMVGPEWYFPQMYADDGIINADGHIFKFRFKNGVVDFQSRWVKTPRWEADRKAHRQLYGKYRNPYTDDPSIREATLKQPNLRTLANTHTLAHNGKLFAIKEDAPPFEIDPKTLDTIPGFYDFGGQYDSETFSAHNKIDPMTGELLAYGYEAAGLCSPDLYVYTIDKTGKITRRWRTKMPEVRMVHDMAATEKHFIFPCGPYVDEPRLAEEGQLPLGLGRQPAEPDRHPAARRRRQGHALVQGQGPGDGAHRERQDRRQYRYDVCRLCRRALRPVHPLLQVDGRVTAEALAGAASQIYVRSQFQERRIQGRDRLERAGRRYRAGRHPIYDLPNRYAYLSHNDPTKPFDEARVGNLRGRVTNVYSQYNLENNAVSTYFAGPTHSLAEPTFVPRGKASRNAVMHGSGDEGDGYVIGLASNLAEMRSELVIADAKHLEDGDVARVILPFRTSGLHGLWIGDDEVDFG